MITITLPIIPTVVAIAFLIGFIFVAAEEGGGYPVGFVVLIAPLFVFFLFHGIFSMFGGY
jgi:hypothetical protein